MDTWRPFLSKLKKVYKSTVIFLCSLMCNWGYLSLRGVWWSKKLVGNSPCLSESTQQSTVNSSWIVPDCMFTGKEQSGHVVWLRGRTRYHWGRGDRGSHEVIVISWWSRCYIGVGPPGPGICTPTGHNCFFWLNEEKQKTENINKNIEWV